MAGIAFCFMSLTVAVMVPAFLVSCSRTENKKQETVKMYVCSMHPEVLQNKPGDCPLCGMALIEKAAEDGKSADIRLNDVVMPVNESVLASVKTVGVTRETRPVILEVSGLINYDTRNLVTVSANYRGLIERSYIKYKFQPVHKGQKIYDIYCPEIYLEHMNYVNLLKKFPDQQDLTYEAREWMRHIGLTEDQIKELITSEKPNFHLSVYSNAEGYAVGNDFDPEADYSFEGDVETAANITPDNPGIGLNEGTTVEAGKPLFKVVRLESVRADLKIPTEDAALLKVGQQVVLTDVVNPANSINTRISQIEPLNGGLFQIVRVYINNPGKRLYPGMKIQAQIQAGKREALWVPREAVAELGQSHGVFLLKDSVFVATGIRTGIISGNKIEIRSGIGEEARVAANASLLTDSDGFIKTGANEKE